MIYFLAMFYFHKLSIYGEAFAEDNNSFLFLPGERDAITKIADTDRHIHLKCDSENRVHKRKN